jgi:hypothetical protein
VAEEVSTLAKSLCDREGEGAISDDAKLSFGGDEGVSEIFSETGN